MTVPPEHINRAVRSWMDLARADLAVAQHSMTMDTPPLPIIAFHLQQSVEKALKAVLVRRMVEFPKTHDIGLLLDFCQEVLPEASNWSDAGRLTQYGVLARYPGVIELNEQHISDGFAIAGRILAVVSSHLESESMSGGQSARHQGA